MGSPENLEGNPAPAASVAAWPPARRAWGCLGRALLVTVAVGIALPALLLLVLQFTPVSTRLANFVLGRISPVPRATLTVGEARGNWITHLELRGLRAARGDTVLVAADTVRVRLHPEELLAGRVVVGRLELVGVRASSDVAGGSARKGGGSPLRLADVLRGRFYHGPTLRVERFLLRDGSYGDAARPEVSGPRLADVTLAARDLELGSGLAVAIDSLALRFNPSDRGVDAAVLRLAASLSEGRLRVDSLRVTGPASVVQGRAMLAFDAGDSLGSMEIELHASPLSLADLEPLVGRHDLEGSLVAEVVLRGPRLDRLWGAVHVDFTEARLGDLRFGSSRLAAEFHDGRAEVEIETVCEEAHAGVRGWVRPLDEIPRYDLALQLDRLPRRLPVGSWWEVLARRGALAARLHLSGHGYGPAELNVQGEMTTGEGSVTLAGGLHVQPELAWELERLAVENVDVAQWVGDTTSSAVTGTITARGHGTAPESLQVTVAWDLAPSRYGSWRIVSAIGRASLDGPQLGASVRLVSEVGSAEMDTLTAGLAGEGEFEIPALRFGGLDLARLTGSPELRSDLNGTLRLKGAGFRRPAQTATGPSGAGLSASGALVLERSLLRGRTIAAGQAALKLHSGALNLDATMVTDAGRIALKAEARPFDARSAYELREARFTDLDLGAWGWVPVSTSLNGRLSGEAKPMARAETEAGATHWPALSGSATLHLDPSTAGWLALTGGETVAVLSDQQFNARGSLHMAGGDATVEADASPGAHGPEGRARLALPFSVLAAFAGRDSLATEGGVRIEAALINAGPRSGTLTASLAGRGKVADWKVDSVFAAMEFAEGVLTVDTLALRSSAITADAAGRIVLSDSTGGPDSDLHLELSVVDPASLRTLLGADTLAAAEGRVQVRLTGRLPAHALSLQGSLRSLAWNDLGVLGARVEAQGELRGDWRPSRATLTAEITRLRSPALRLDGAKVGADFDGHELGFDVAAQVDPARSVWLTGTAAREPSGFRVQLAEARVQAGTIRWELVRPAQLLYGDGRLVIDSLEARSDIGCVSAGGIFDRGGSHDFRVQADNVGLAVFGGWLRRPDLGGRLDGRLSISGPAAEPQADGTLRIAPVLSGAPAGVVDAQLHWDGQRAHVKASFASPGGDSLTATGRFPLALSLAMTDSAQASRPTRVFEGDIDLRASARRFPLPALAPLVPSGAISDLGGTLDVDLHLAGNSAELRGEGRIGIADGTIGLPSLGVVYREIQLDGVLSGDRFTLRRAEVQSPKGRLELSGDVRVANLKTIEPNLSVTSKDFLFTDTPDLRVLASGELRLSGTLAAPEVRGQVTASGCSYTIPRAAVGGTQSASSIVLMPADIRLMEETFGYQAAPGASPMQGLFDAADVDLQVSLGRDNWVRKRTAPGVALEITGQVRVRKQPGGEPNLEGRIAPVPGRSYIQQFGRTFDFTGGEVLLNGGMKDHTVDIQTEYKVRTPGSSDEPDVVVHLNVQGDMDKMQLALSSEPPLSETEIISYIMTGQSPIKPQAGSDQGQEDAAALAADMGLSRVTGALEGVVQEKVGLDVLQVRYDALLGATLVAGRYLEPTLYVGVQQPLQYQDTGDQSSQNPYATAVEFEYEAYRWLVLNLQAESSLLRSFLKASHAY